jgi:hypothetical protein
MSAIAFSPIIANAARVATAKILPTTSHYYTIPVATRGRYSYYQVSSYASTAYTHSPATKGGAGCGNVHDQMLPTSQEEAVQLYKHLTRPKTVSIIGGE